MKSKEKRKSKNNNLKHQTDGHNTPNSSYDKEKNDGSNKDIPKRKKERKVTFTPINK